MAASPLFVIGSGNARQLINLMHVRRIGENSDGSAWIETDARMISEPGVKFADLVALLEPLAPAVLEPEPAAPAAVEPAAETAPAAPTAKA